MAVFKCKMCGGTLDVSEGMTVCECEYCGTAQTLPKLDNEKRNQLFDRANHYRMNKEFDKAAVVYENILAEAPDEAEAHWGMCLCRYGIEYVVDPKTSKRIPTCHRTQFKSILEDEDYLSAVKNCDGIARAVYNSEAMYIDGVQKKILEISAKEEPFDIFICYKESDNAGNRTTDSVIAQDIYNELTNKGYKVFFARITLEDKIGSAYEPYIFAALNSSKIMLVLGTKPEHFNAVWVKNEWSRYLSLIEQGQKKTIIPCYRDMTPYDLPVEFVALQSQDVSKVGYMQDLLRGIEKILGIHNQKVTTVYARNDKQKEIAFDESVYIGDAVGGKPHGFGVMEYINGNKYEGEWSVGKRHGKGKLTRAEYGSSWSGEFKNDDFWNGSGRVFYGDGDYYDGELKYGKQNGQGKYTFANGAVYEGDFLNDMHNGKGKCTYTDGSVYEGDFLNNQPNGKGKYIYADGSAYEGNFFNSYRNGKGKLTYANDDVYEGDFAYDKLSGQGNYTYADGSCWIGEFVAGERWDGSGIIRYDDGSYYDGQMKDGEYDQGKLTYANGDVYEGEFLHDQYNGKGKYIYANGDIYEGHFLNDKYSGQGKLTHTDGSFWIGEFYSNELWNGNGKVKIGNNIKDVVKIDGEDFETRELRQKNLCQHCGSEFKGLIKKVCSKCGKLKDY